MARCNNERNWFFEKRLGLFLHWGLYAIHGWHEQEQWRGRVGRAAYAKLREQWNPTLRSSRGAGPCRADGMGYVCLTTKP